MLEPLALEPLKDEGIQGKSFKTFIIFYLLTHCELNNACSEAKIEQTKSWQHFRVDPL